MTKDRILNVFYINESQVHIETLDGIILFDLSMTIDGITLKIQPM